MNAELNPPAPATLEDFRGLIGREFVGAWRLVDAERHAAFVHGTYLDVAYPDGIDDAYPTGMLEGFHLLGLLDYLTSELVGTWYGFNYGLDRARFVSPVTLDDRIRVRVTVDAVTERNGGLLVTYEAVLDVEDRERPGLAARWLVLLLPHPNEPT
jgi:hypothetical protein